MDVIIVGLLLMAGIILVVAIIPHAFNKVVSSTSLAIANARGEKRKQAEDQARIRRMNHIIESNTFKTLENKIFTSSNPDPFKIRWDGKCIGIFLSDTLLPKTTISCDNIPDEVDFMRALNFKYGKNYTYDEFTCADDYPDRNGELHDKSKVEMATLTKRISKPFKPSW